MKTINKKTAFRHELKYIISYPEAALMKQRLKELMTVDVHAGDVGEYTIRSLYFDDYFGSAYKEKECGIYARKKYRVRIYNCQDDFISFERKTKNDQYIYKESVRITRDQLEMIMSGDYGFLEKSDNPLLRELYFEFSSRLLRPRVIVDYEREPYTYEAGAVRITFDKHVRGSSNFNLFDPDIPAIETMPGDRLILEVKFTQFLPGIIRKVLPPKAAENTAVSKFVMCCDVCPSAMSRFGNGNNMQIGKEFQY